MSNFIDHWLNSIPIEEATRAKKLKRKGMISPEDYAKAEQTLEQTLSRYVTDDPEKMHYITFISDMATAKEIGDDDDLKVDIRRKEKNHHHRVRLVSTHSPAMILRMAFILIL